MKAAVANTAPRVRPPWVVLAMLSIFHMRWSSLFWPRASTARRRWRFGDVQAAPGRLRSAQVRGPRGPVSTSRTRAIHTRVTASWTRASGVIGGVPGAMSRRAFRPVSVDKAEPGGLRVGATPAGRRRHRL